MEGARSFTIALDLAAWPSRAARSLAQALAAISEAHVTRGHPSPRKAAEVREVWKGIRRWLGAASLRRSSRSTSRIYASPADGLEVLVRNSKTTRRVKARRRAR